MKTIKSIKFIAVPEGMQVLDMDMIRGGSVISNRCSLNMCQLYIPTSIPPDSLWRPIVISTPTTAKLIRQEMY